VERRKIRSEDRRALRMTYKVWYAAVLLGKRLPNFTPHGLSDVLGGISGNGRCPSMRWPICSISTIPFCGDGCGITYSPQNTQRGPTNSQASPKP
jgi:hypothetical protein